MGVPSSEYPSLYIVEAMFCFIKLKVAKMATICEGPSKKWVHYFF
jgi:hypothetical protein